MQYLALLPLLLAPLAAAAPAADSNVFIYDATDFRGQQRKVPVNGVCVNLGPPFSTIHRGIRSVRFTEEQGENCEFYRLQNCQSPIVQIFESQQQISIVAHSIRCSKNSLASA